MANTIWRANVTGARYWLIDLDYMRGPSRDGLAGQPAPPGYKPPHPDLYFEPQRSSVLRIVIILAIRWRLTFVVSVEYK
ncbi:hypothetical protein AG1IA_07997 [Rhizoctonia solani AG-1 IA]|uniref:Uncharacterized protein n=1 Tax=Thanatephorus cucumeris (strain AG1-IA) TaxID=983506 RepID=L8WME3_THACA|nr:hypothetical protein AG1IA_07997 [Rhizoctonia solani AG-1 IA]